MATRPDQPDPSGHPSPVDAGTYLVPRFDQLAAAIRDGNGPAARQIIDRIRADGHDQAAGHVEDGFIAAGLARDDVDKQ